MRPTRRASRQFDATISPSAPPIICTRRSRLFTQPAAPYRAVGGSAARVDRLARGPLRAAHRRAWHASSRDARAAATTRSLARVLCSADWCSPGNGGSTEGLAAFRESAARYEAVRARVRRQRLFIARGCAADARRAERKLGVHRANARRSLTRARDRSAGTCCCTTPRCSPRARIFTKRPCCSRMARFARPPKRAPGALTEATIQRALANVRRGDARRSARRFRSRLAAGRGNAGRPFRSYANAELEIVRAQLR